MMLQFGDPPQHRVRWIGPWPPPDRLLLARGHITGETAVVDPDEVDDVALATAALHATIQPWVRYRYSRLSEDTEHVERGALYVKEA